jgi:hypothetical protein
MRDGKRAALGLALLLGVAGLGAGVWQATRPRAPLVGSATSSPAAAAVLPARGTSPMLGERRADSDSRDRTATSPTPRAHAALAAADALPPARAAEPPASAGTAPPDREPTRAPLPRILLEPVVAAPGAVTASFAGIDTGAPRTLALWRVDARRPQRLGRATSDASARIQAPQLALPEAGLALVVTPIGVRPGEPGASPPLQLARAPGTSPDADRAAAGSPRWRLFAADPSTQGDFR